MRNFVCRAIKMINYHIPLGMNCGDEVQYVSLGFFDGMFTEKIKIDYKDEDMKELWRYSIRNTLESQGGYSHQKVFCFSDDSWNECRDEDFWSMEVDKKYPLSFVVFFQLSDYLAGDKNIEKQCKAFNEKLKNELQNKGIYYSYTTIDKNDYVICIKSQKYQDTVNAIKKLHETGQEVVYSYTIFSINRSVLEAFNEVEYSVTFNEVIDSICLKGITNSFHSSYNGIGLDLKYKKFCENVAEQLYNGEQKKDNRIYDILGDTDFRLIARDVKLGHLLELYSSKGMLSYGNRDKHFRFYLYSSNMALNSMIDLNDEKYSSEISDEVIKKTEDEMENVFKTNRCNELSGSMEEIERRLKNISKEKTNEKIVTFCQALWQLVQSLKVLEAAPTKKYDFYSLYHPLSALVRVLVNKLQNNEDIGEEEEIYDFIHKISMTLHGTLRTDIQFFQIRDFNVIVHYAPAKLRAFYSIWAFELVDFYNSFGDSTHGKYSFIFSPGMFDTIFVKELFSACDEKERVMLISLPERQLYLPKWLSVIISHEVSHFVGHDLRNRPERHTAWLRNITRIICLEWNHLMYSLATEPAWKNAIEKMIKSNPFLQKRMEELIYHEVEELIDDTTYIYHSGNSINCIGLGYREFYKKNINMTIKEYRTILSNYLEEHFNKSGKIKGQTVQDISKFCNKQEENWLVLFQRFYYEAFFPVLENMKYILSEAFADLMAVLTLHLSPEDYIVSFIKSEYNNEVSTKITAISIRMALVIEVVKTIVLENKNWYKKSDNNFWSNWSGNVLKFLSQKFAKDSVEEVLVLKAFGYRKAIRNFSDKISSYDSLYCHEEYIFSREKKEYLKDSIVWNNMFEYLHNCACFYVKDLKNDANLLEKQKKLQRHYNVFASNDVLQIIQEVENFLSEYENMQIK